ncbi:dystrobrevin binding protein dysbindin isoform X3 [Bombus vancouverensis nearcticus]|uniref:dystrobrevin binding protein dysbindin isoform X3 n=1 Tax=Bombus vancouverensis nearcticus TaxID=2705178 RepID=UPI00402B1788
MKALLNRTAPTCSSTLRNKFQTVQEGISASIRGLTVVENPKQKKTGNIRNVNYNAGADILHRFQLQWNELHELAEENAGKAQEADKLIGTIYEKLEQEWKNITCLNSTLAYIPKINNAIQDLMDQIAKLADEHIERVSKYELKQQKMMKERRETFDEAFKEELREYKATGSISKLPVTQQGPSLDEIVLDVDSTIFNEFLKN